MGQKVNEENGDPSPCEGNESEISQAGETQLIMPHRARENAVALSEGLDCSLCKSEKPSHALICHCPLNGNVPGGGTKFYP